MTLKSGNHADAELDGKSWSCSACGSESMDYQLFEELGDIESCIEKHGPPAVIAKMPEEKLVRAARAKIYELGQAAQYAEGELKKISGVLSPTGGTPASAGTHIRTGPVITKIYYTPPSAAGMDYMRDVTKKRIEYKTMARKYI